MNPYAVLGLDEKASARTVKDAYRKLSAIYHPDKETGDREKFDSIKLAHDILTNPARRKRYDTTGRTDDIRATPDRVEAFLREVLRKTVDAQRPDGTSDDPVFENIADKLRLSLHGARVPLKNDRFLLERKLERAVRLLERFQPRGDYDPIRMILREEKERLEQELLLNQDALELSIEAERIIMTYNYNVGPGSEGQFNPGPTGHRLLGGSRC